MYDARNPSWCSVTTWGNGAGKEVGEGLKREGSHICLWPIHAGVWQRPPQYCKVIILQVKQINNFSKLFGEKTRVKSADHPNGRVACHLGVISGYSAIRCHHWEKLDKGYMLGLFSP